MLFLISETVVILIILHGVEIFEQARPIIVFALIRVEYLLESFVDFLVICVELFCCILRFVLALNDTLLTLHLLQVILVTLTFGFAVRAALLERWVHDVNNLVIDDLRLKLLVVLG